MSQLLVESAAQDGLSPKQPMSLDNRDTPFRSQHAGSLPLPSSTRSAPTPVVGPSQDKPTRLGDFFAIAKEPRLRYSDWEILEISRHLERKQRHAWSQAPRLYTVLRIIGQLQFFDDILDQGISDVWFPFKIISVPTVMSPSMRNSFLEVQPLVLTKAVDLEKDEKKQHAHFGREDTFPFEVRDKLGSGRHGTVHKIFSPFSRREFARKRFKRLGGPTQKGEVRNFQTELQVLKKIQHHHCIELIASYTDTKYFGLIMSPVADCDLTKYYALAEKDTTNRRTMRKFFGCLASGLCYLHDIKIRHRDIKPENILVRGSDVLLSDFGISLDWEHLSRSTTTEDAGKTWIYCAPEVADYQPRNRSSDIWSLGCVFLEMSTVLKGQSLDTMRQCFRNRSESRRFYQNQTAIKEWLNGLADRSGDDNDPLDWIKLMLQKDPNSRPRADGLLGMIKNAASQKDGGKQMYCGDCCASGEESDSSVESLSDDYLWAGNLAIEAEKEGRATSLRTGDAAKPGGSGANPSLDGVSVFAVPSLSVPVTRKPRTKIRQKGARNALDSVPSALLPTKAIDHAENQEASRNTIRETKLSSHSANSPRPPKPTTALTPIIKISDHSADSPQLPKPTIALAPTMSVDAWSSPGVIDDMNKADLRGHLPELTSMSWQTPSSLLGAVKKDARFMAYLQAQAPHAYDLIEVATTKDMARLIQLLLDNGLNVYSRESIGDLPPILSIMNWDRGDWEPSFLAMIHVKVAASQLKIHQNSIFVRAAVLGHVGAMRALIQSGAGPEAESRTAARALIGAVKNNQIDAVNYLVETIKVEPDLQRPGLPEGVDSDNDRSDKRTTDTHLFDLGGSTPLSWAASKGYMEVVRVLFVNGASLHPDYCPHPLQAAAQNNYLKVVQYLIEVGAQASRRCVHSRTPLHTASQNGHASIVQYLLESADVKVDEADGDETPLHAAVRQGRTEVVRVLLLHGANPNWEFKSYETAFRPNERPCPLHVAVAQNDVEIVKLLLKGGANLSMRTISFDRGDTAIDVAWRKGYTEILLLLEKARERQAVEKAKRRSL